MSKFIKPSPVNFQSVRRGQNSLRVQDAEACSEIELLGAIGKSCFDEAGITEKEFRNALKHIPSGRSITLKINSEGGSVQEGLGIYNAIKERSGDITARITGYALSIASVLPLGAGKVVSPKSAIWMMHKAWAWAQGNADDMRQAADMLETHDETLVDIYAAETGKDKDEIRAAMEKETWMKGSEAVAFGLADECEPEEEEAEARAYRALPESYVKRCKNVAPEILNCLRGKAAGEPVAITQVSAVASGGQPKPNETNIMNKKTIVALLLKHGIEASETETEEQLQAKLESIPPAKAATTDGSVTEIAAIRNQLAAEKRQRITERVNSYVDQCKITKDETTVWIDAALNDSEKTFGILDAKPAVEVGGEPIGFNRIEGGERPVLAGYQGRPTEKIANMWKEKTTPEARWNAFREDFPMFYRDAVAAGQRGRVQAADSNSFAGAITTNFLIVGAITQLGPQIAMLKAFSRDNSVDPYKPLATGVQKLNTTLQDGSLVMTNATDFTGGSTYQDSTLTGPTISVAQYTSPFHLSNAQLNSGIQMANLVTAKLGGLKSKIAQVVTAPITTTNFGTVAGTTGAALPLVSAPEAFGFSDLATLQGALKKSPIKNVILDGEYIARIANTPGFFQAAGTLGGLEGAWKAFGWDLICLNTDWTGAGANIRGFACNPQAIGVITGLPLNPMEGIPGNIIQVGSAILPGPEVAIATYLWMDANARTMRATYDIMLGAAAIDKTAAVLVKSA